MAIHYSKYFKSIFNFTKLRTFNYVQKANDAAINTNITFSRIARTAVADGIVHFSEYVEDVSGNHVLLNRRLSQAKFARDSGWSNFRENFAATGGQKFNLFAYPFAFIRFLKLSFCEGINRLDRHVGNWLDNGVGFRFWFGASMGNGSSYTSSRVAVFFKALAFYTLSLVEIPLLFATKLLEPLVSPQKTWRALPFGVRDRLLKTRRGNTLGAVVALLVAVLGGVFVASPALFGLGAVASVGLAYAIGISLLVGGVLASAFCLCAGTLETCQPPVENGLMGPSGYHSFDFGGGRSLPPAKPLLSVDHFNDSPENSDEDEEENSASCFSCLRPNRD